MIGSIKKVGNDIMFHAINHANIHDVIALLNDNEVDVNCTNINGQTPLHVRKLSPNLFGARTQNSSYEPIRF